MADFTGVPRAFDYRDPKRAREEEARKREQATSARNTSNTAVGAGGRLDIDGGTFSVSNGGNAVVRDGGRFLVQDGGSLDITDDGEVAASGTAVDHQESVLRTARAALRTEEVFSSYSGLTFRQPGVYFSTEMAEGGSLYSFRGDDVIATSGIAPVIAGPLVEPSVNQQSSILVGPENLSLTSSAFFGEDPQPSDIRATCTLEATPDSYLMRLRHTATVASMSVSVADPVLRIFATGGVDITGPLTVNGSPVGGGAVTSVAGKTGAVTLVKGDVGLGNVDNTSDANKPVSTATQTALDGKAAATHTHTTSQVTGLDTALAGKASTAVATTTTAGLMSAADKVKLDAAGSATLISCYIATGSKTNFATSDQAITTPGFSASRSNANIATPAAGKLTVTEAGVYTITFSLALYTTAAMTTIKPVTGRSFVDISDSASVPYSRTAIPVGENVTTGNQGGILLAAGAELKFNIIQTSGGTAYYRATIWIVKHP